MDYLEIELLDACREVELRHNEMLPLLASALGVSREEVFYTWALRKCRQRGELLKEPWVYFFHGLECDLKNTADGRFLRFDFGPRGRVDTVSAWGVLQFIMTSTSPWPDFPSLKQRFARTEPPYDQFAGDFFRFCEAWDRLEHQGCFEPADAELVKFLAQYTSIGPDGIQRVSFPPGTPEKTQIDCSVAHRSVLSAHARQLLERHLTQRGS
jgi:hypothetical protein